MNFLKKIKYYLLLFYYSFPTIIIKPPSKSPKERVEEKLSYGYSYPDGYYSLDFELMAWLLPRLKLHYNLMEKDNAGIPHGFQKNTWLEVVADMIYFVENYDSHFPSRIDEKRLNKGRRDLIRYLDRLWN